MTEILNEKIPVIQERNARVTESLEQIFPHLSGFFEENAVGLIDRNQSLEIAQKKFFHAQKEILEASSLSDVQYQKSLEMSSRVLTEYILYRNIIISKLKLIDRKNSEADIHNIIVPMQKIFDQKNIMHDLYTNNAWLLDDKYMSYSTILSNRDMDEVVKHILIEGEDIEKDRKQPDIALIFSSDPNMSQKVDVVVVELKKLELKLERKNDVVVQLISRATKLLKYYPDKIQRIWFYGIVDIDKGFKLLLKGNGFTELYSNDTVMYKPQDIYIDDDIKIPIGIYIQSFDAFIDDAESRNSTFLNLLKNNLHERIKETQDREDDLPW